MLTHRTIRIAILALLIGVGSVNAADLKQEGMKSPAAREAKSQFERKQSQLEKEYREKMAALRKEYVSALDKAKDEATKRADLDEAINIRAESEEIKKQDTANMPVGPSKFTLAKNELAARLSKTTWTYPSSDSFTFNADGTLGRSDNWTTGWWVPVDEHSVVIVYAKGGAIDRITFEDRSTRVTGISFQSAKTWEPRKVER